ncbi:sugar isomerase domain-containing protein [Lonepinella sp. BR2271]|uniref:sugar isomerase domain-containing protein n=1 Tax=unclassified Lonepinella TaxID=2642006 RepID=UPI003F6DB450
MFDYIEKIRAILTLIEEKERMAIEQTVELFVQAITEKRSLYIFGASHAGILTQELYYRAGGLMLINPIFAREVLLDREPITFTSQMERLEGYGTAIASTVNFHKDDILIIHSVSGRNAIVLDLALAAKQKGVKIIALTNVAYSQSVSSRHVSGQRLFELADVVLDNHGDIGDATCKIQGIEQKVGPTSTVIGATILNTVVVETCRRLVELGVTSPPIFYSANLDGGDEKNKELYNDYKESIHYQF